MSSTMEATDDEELKARHRQKRTLGNDGAVAREVIPELGPELVAAAGVRGTGSAAIDMDPPTLTARKSG